MDRVHGYLPSALAALLRWDALEFARELEDAR
jgi:hypothetical protein